MPYILVVYDAQSDVAYCLYVQAYFENLADFDLAQAGNSVSIHIDQNNTVDQSAIQRFAIYRDAVMNQLDRVIRHNA